MIAENIIISSKIQQNSWYMQKIPLKPNYPDPGGKAARV